MIEFNPVTGTPEKENIFHGENKIIENVFTQSEIIEIMSNAVNTRNVTFKDRLSQRNHIIILSKEVEAKVIKMAEELSGTTGLYVDGSSYAVYQNVRSPDAPVRRPRLESHYDTNMGGPRVTIDVQMASNISWPLVIDDKQYDLKDNQALLFAGTNQLHGRIDKMFNDDQYVHMLFLHFAKRGENE